MPKDPIYKGLGDVLGGIPLDSIQPRDGITTKVDLATLTSYNLLPKQRKTIVVPGSPSIWRPPNTPRKVKADAGKYQMDPNRHVFPKCSLEPLFRALSLTQPNMKLNDIDLVTDRRNLRLLLGFVSAKKNTFRIDVEVVNNTVLFSCWTPKAVNYVKGFHGYGHEFEKVSTRQPKAVRNSLTHNRIIRYMFGDVKIIMRYEVDGCTGSDKDIRTAMPISEVQRTPTGYTVLKCGQLVSPSRIIEIKTGAAGKNLVISKNTEQLWFSQTPFLCAGHYDEVGNFTSITKKNHLKLGTLQKWENSHQEQLKKLATLLRVIVELAKAAAWKKFALVSSENTLKVFGLTNQNDKGLPVDLHSMWE
ncbi:hypothetical protein BDV35DRAFT_193153, partial [Aspergillus flavus]|uniref:RAI1-like domain-containing protein n=3 Tax=Aspergillus subgen. Circumdati TaxID=2720871 RepID=A0A1S9E144_ASPOZ|eukprot:EIT77064.1 hypothetical protein Ao3042_06814 [Aspergillus oryzae 3.042]